MTLLRPALNCLATLVNNFVSLVIAESTRNKIQNCNIKCSLLYEDQPLVVCSFYAYFIILGTYNIYLVDLPPNHWFLLSEFLNDEKVEGATTESTLLPSPPTKVNDNRFKFYFNLPKAGMSAQQARKSRKRTVNDGNVDRKISSNDVTARVSSILFFSKFYQHVVIPQTRWPQNALFF